MSETRERAEGIKAGSRVEMTQMGYDNGLQGTCGRPCCGTVRRIARDGALVVVRDGLVTEEKYHPVFWRLATPTHRRCIPRRIILHHPQGCRFCDVHAAEETEILSKESEVSGG